VEGYGVDISYAGHTSFGVVFDFVFLLVEFTFPE
jgi:hypothetical protein